jgi:hypothetical protein
MYFGGIKMNENLMLMLLFAMVGIPFFGSIIYFAYQAWLKSVAVVCVFMTSDRKIKSMKLRVKDGVVTYGDKTFLLNNDLFMIGKGNWPTYYFKMDDASPLNMLEFESSGLGSSELNAQINGSIMRDLIGAFQKKLDAASMAMIFGIATIAAVGAVIYLMMDKFTEVMNLLAEIREILRIIGGI